MKLVSGIRPSGVLTIANYLGALKQWIELQDKYESYVFVADLHAITTPYEPKTFRQSIYDTLALYIAFGLNPKKTAVFLQSEMHEHAELGWLFQTFMPIGELERMTQYKDKVKEGAPAMTGLLTYPALMAADILLYKPDVVPVGEDQVQHIEFTREVARRFNKKFGDVFPLPKPFLPNTKGAERILSLKDPEKKMSKSHREDTYITLLDAPDRIKTKLKSAVTDSGKEISFDEQKKPAVSNLLVIAGGFSGKPIKELEREWAGKGYGEFKLGVAEIIIEKLRPIQDTFKDLRSDTAYLKKVLSEGREKAAPVAAATLAEVRQKMGLV